MTENKSPVDRALELLVFAPLGLAIEARRILPDLVEKGRQQATGQVTVARMIGQMAVQQGQVEAGKALDKAQRQATAALRDMGIMPRPADTPGGNGESAPAAEAPAPGRPAASPPPAPRPSPAAAPHTPASPAPETPGPAPGGGGTTTRAADLAIPDYDSLSASQVVPRLAGLSTAELEAVRAYEAGHRARKTILNRVAQLQSGA